MMRKGLSLMGWFNSLLQTRLTNLSGRRRSVFRKLLRECLDKGYDIIELLLWWLETAFAVRRDDELVPPDTCAVTVRADIGRITQAVTLFR
jgi:hypothetical protein